ncbi:putative membrane protein [Gluconacetobacter diazotrophicus PA1 5]|uniref:Putative membrane protein n=1 Tax=Gluconacetobacter diazotrophicus (strain ATCC 49037 / DSM 5601 / CCUG 37298 / CIP 103539 / LMG 7603 / PAl5) TaxID=272568 RepID=A9HDL2_GLUDA|nr:putative membrane protein [Gluconacetobacter diazotrophicus PA1 5]
MDVASVLPMVAFLPLVAALMVATAVADRIA